MVQISKQSKKLKTLKSLKNRQNSNHIGKILKIRLRLTKFIKEVSRCLNLRLTDKNLAKRLKRKEI
jgi:hypothetical protein